MQSTFSFAQLQEDFSDRDYTRDPEWILSDPSDWSINTIKQLQSNRLIPNSYCWISTPHSLVDSVQWEIDVHLLFNPSSLNYLDIYLISSDSIPIANTTTGYFVRLGNTEDEISLYRKDADNKIIKIIDGVNGLLNKSENRYRLKVTRRGKSKWGLWYDESMSGSQYVNGGTGIDSTYQQSRYFSILIQQSSSGFFQKHFIDNISIRSFVPDKTPPYLLKSSIINTETIQLQFNEEIHPSSAIDISNYVMNNGVGQTRSVTKDSLIINSCNILLDQQLLSGKEYQMLIKNISDVSGNKMKDTLVPLFFYTPQRGDVIINEILFNPTGNGSDYVEIMNRSSYPINLNGFSLANINLSASSINVKKIFTNDYEIKPGEYLVFTDDKENIISTFRVRQKEKIFALSSMPSLPNETGNIRLTDNEGLIIDELYYDENWHFPLLNQREGVALERIYPGEPTQNKNNWNSASKSSGYGTPTGPNSQSQIARETNTEISFSSEIFSPDQDGNVDVLLIQYTFPEGGYLLNCNIFDRMGRPVRTLQRNMLCGASGQFKWDGLDEQNRALPMGHYIILTETFNLKGAVKKIKKEIVLARRK
jgi:hypothetical protein